ncbi:MAG: hypothetical protein AB1458_01455 [Bacteroidota bacterium]
MKKKVSAELRRLFAEKGNLCVSVIIPLHTDTTQQKADRLAARHALDNARILLDLRFRSLADELGSRLWRLYERIPFGEGWGGAGLFVSRNIAQMVLFPFPVRAKITASDSFETRDVVYKETFLRDYLVLSISRNEAHLFRGKGQELAEVRDRSFPAYYEDDYEYSYPSRASSFSSALKQFEKDKSATKAVRAGQFYNELDKSLDRYLDHMPLVIAGPEKDMSNFADTSGHSDSIIAGIKGNYDRLPHELALRAWKAVRAHKLRQQERIIASLRELPGFRNMAMGIRDVWRDAKEGRGHILVVERDYRKPGFIAGDEYKLLLRPPKHKHKKVPDAVDDVIETVLEMNGEVIFTDNGRLAGYGHIVLIGRY